MVALISELSSLETLFLGFQSPESHPDSESRSPPPLKRSILPALRRFHFDGYTEYLEDLVTSIDAPQLKHFYVFFHISVQIDFDIPRLAQFINCTPTLGACDEAHVEFDAYTTCIKLPAGDGTLEILFLSGGLPSHQVSTIVRVCNFLPPFSTVEDLYIEHLYSEPVWDYDAVEWLRLLLPFTAVKNLYLSRKSAIGIAAALRELVGGRTTEVSPILQNIFVQGYSELGPFHSHIEQFAAARRLSGHPIAILRWRQGVIQAVGDQ